MTTIPDWLDRYPVTQTWEQHVANTGRGGIDWAMPIGTPLYTPSAGLVVYVEANGEWGNSITIVRADGTKTDYLHCSRLAGSNGRRAGDRELVGYSGNTGKSTGPHLHVHDRTAGNNRRRPFSTITDPEDQEDLVQAKIHKRGSEFIVFVPWDEGGGYTTTNKAFAEADARVLLKGGIADIQDAGHLSSGEWSQMKSAIQRHAASRTTPAGAGPLTVSLEGTVKPA